ncbi:MAG TPA: LacI family DNA-binding transcriptional regulator [Steroidobacteraceae bacterium]|nr:LacI family DNA-binding transcriptional regulator [Steroidobacteraceae bacterium]
MKTSSRRAKARREHSDRGEPPTPKQARTRARLTITDIARLAGVSKKTVSRVINQAPYVQADTRARIESIIAEHGYQPDPQARGLAFRRSFLVGMIHDNPNPQYVENIQLGILDALAGRGYELVIRPCDRRSPTFLEDMRGFVERLRLFGVVLTPSVSEDDRLAKLLESADCPYVRVACASVDKPSRMVLTHDARGAAAAARRLAELGHSRIAYLSGPPLFRSSHERRAGFIAGLAEYGLELAPDLAILGAYTYESGLARGRELLARPDRPTAIFAGNDEMATGVYSAAHELGIRIPEDLSVIGFDDAPIATRIWPAMTSVRLPVREMGRTAAEGLFAASKAAAKAPLAEFTPSLIERDSTAPPPRSRSQRA